MTTIANSDIDDVLQQCEEKLATAAGLDLESKLDRARHGVELHAKLLKLKAPVLGTGTVEQKQRFRSLVVKMLEDLFDIKTDEADRIADRETDPLP